jgi:putative ABC transport system substrate-binding protein
MKTAVRRKVRGASEKDMKGKISVLTLCAMLLALCGPVDAQQPGKIFRIGFLAVSTAAGNAALLETFRQEMGKFGWIEGKNISFEYRYGGQKAERLPELAKELAHLKVDLILVVATPAALAAKGATSSIPIVMVNAGNPVGKFIARAK